eukprot:1834616-Rhodomonas_salina.1
MARLQPMLARCSLQCRSKSFPTPCPLDSGSTYNPQIDPSLNVRCSITRGKGPSHVWHATDPITFPAESRATKDWNSSLLRARSMKFCVAGPTSFLKAELDFPLSSHTFLQLLMTTKSDLAPAGVTTKS